MKIIPGAAEYWAELDDLEQELYGLPGFVSAEQLAVTAAASGIRRHRREQIDSLARAVWAAPAAEPHLDRCRELITANDPHWQIDEAVELETVRMGLNPLNGVRDIQLDGSL